ncbi:DNA/RNA nuclease SfsA [Oceanospirillum linum]|uniref:Sugar fermentation stimulation protein homolog n=1 Tax=Oceanospirillum linum TaxID=966 RepID=A0A1T1H8V8_OCELI|nr:DNA/RNA nuclease SfsA [Oceanospirillum linum]OOV86245.1 sugar fermentation stimulation protein SfsA [Oceanospirillum linum]SEG37534.1 sugar fermentation stimulation protein A [Oleiphilus messinensis]SMP32299.1 sugar fermentation stimulation protein A [Oceanospirillum linum]
MRWSSPLKSATLLKRYKRFMADVVPEDLSGYQADGAEQLTLHCPNTGSMRNCMGEGWRVWYSDSGNPKRKYPCTWELSETPDGNLICVNTAQANRIVKEALQNKVLAELAAYDAIKPEVKYGAENSRIDFLLTAEGLPNCYVEVKSATLLDESFGKGQGFFPDAVTERGRKHLRELQQMVTEGHRAILLFCVNHTGINQIGVADHIDPAYGQVLREALQAGVEVLAYKSLIDTETIQLWQSVPVVLSEQAYR